MKKQSKSYLVFIILISILIVPSIALAAWWNPLSWNVWSNIWNFVFHQQTPAVQQQNTNQHQNLLTDNQISDWKTYVDQENKFSFQYPKEWVVNTTGSLVNVWSSASKMQQSIDPKNAGMPPIYPEFSINYEDAATFKSFAKGLLGRDVTGVKDFVSSYKFFGNYAETSMGGRNAYAVISVANRAVYTVYTELNNGVYIFSTEDSTPVNQSYDPKNPNISKDVQKIISTFKFTNQNTNQNNTTTNIKPVPTQSYSSDYQLLKQPRGDESTKYIDDGVVSSGTYTAYHRIIGLQISGELGRAVSYFVFVTQNYKTFYFDPQLTQNFPGTDDLSLFDQTKVVGKVSGIPLNQPETIPLGNFILVRQSYFSADTFDDYTIGNNPNELSNNISGLRFFAGQSTGNGYQSPNSSLQDLNSYISGITQVKITDQYGLIFNYSLVSQENHSRQVIIDQEKTYAENPFYSSVDFSPGFQSYSSYDLPFPGGCGGINSSGYVLKNISMSDLVPVGKTLSGTQLYSLKNLNNPLNKDEYKAKIINVYEAGYQGAQAEAEKLNKGTPEPTFNDYIAKNPILIFQDPWNRFIAIGEYQYLLMGGCGKPVVYLYPKTPTEVKVSLEKPTQFTANIPTYDNGWDVLANPDGSLKDLQPQHTDCSTINTQVFGSEYADDACKNNNYPYLYWAGRVSNIYPNVDTGWVVAKGNLASFISQKLAIIGLDNKEVSDMTSYWVPELLAKDVPYYRISFFQNKEMNAFAPMNIFPAPDTAIRVFLDWSPLENSNLKIQPEKLNHIDRKGFTIVEWGGLKQ